MPRSHFSKRLAPAEPGLERSGHKQFAPDPASRLGVKPARPPLVTPRRLMRHADHAKTHARDAEIRTSRSPSSILALCPELSRFHQRRVTLSRLHEGQRESHPLGFAGKRWPPRPQDASQRCAPPTARPQEAQNGPASAPDTFAAGKPCLMPLPLTPPQPAPWEESGPGAESGEPGLCFGSPSV